MSSTQAFRREHEHEQMSWTSDRDLTHVVALLRNRRYKTTRQRSLACVYRDDVRYTWLSPSARVVRLFRMHRLLFVRFDRGIMAASAAIIRCLDMAFLSQSAIHAVNRSSNIYSLIIILVQNKPASWSNFSSPRPLLVNVKSINRDSALQNTIIVNSSNASRLQSTT